MRRCGRSDAPALQGTVRRACARYGTALRDRLNPNGLSLSPKRWATEYVSGRTADSQTVCQAACLCVRTCVYSQNPIVSLALHSCLLACIIPVPHRSSQCFLVTPGVRSLPSHTFLLISSAQNPVWVSGGRALLMAAFVECVCFALIDNNECRLALLLTICC